MDRLTPQQARVRADARRFQAEVARMQLAIWQDRLARFDIVASGRLRHSLTSHVRHDAHTMGAEMIFTFVAYGLYQDRGTGRGYTRGNGSDLPFLGQAYRYTHRLDQPRKVGPAWGGGTTSGQPRQRRPWFSRAWWVTQQVVREGMVRLVGDAFKGQFSTIEQITL